MTLILLTLVVFGKPAFAQEAEPPPNKPINFNPVPPPGKPKTRHKSTSVRKLPAMTLVCEVNNQRYLTHSQQEEDDCKARQGRLTSAAGNPGKYKNLSDKPDPRPNYLPVHNQGIGPRGDPVLSNILHNPVED